MDFTCIPPRLTQRAKYFADRNINRISVKELLNLEGFPDETPPNPFYLEHSNISISLRQVPPNRRKCFRGCERGHMCPMNHPVSLDCSPCKTIVKIFTECGHFKALKCFLVPLGLKVYDEKCREPCLKLLLCGHPCSQICHKPCGGPCTRMTEKALPSCDHKIKVSCDTKVNYAEYRCEVKTSSKTPALCGHTIKNIPCYYNQAYTPWDMIAFCNEPCEIFFEETCFHQCTGNCKDCFGGTFHKKCLEQCRSTLFCGHLCSSPCSSFCQPCEMKCLEQCRHKSCPLPCGQPCSLEQPCQEPCGATCPHTSCSKKCENVCDKKICEEPCTLVSYDGKKCIGMCDEPCVFSSITNSEDQKVLTDALFLMKSEPEKNDRFIYLSECEHLVLKEFMDIYMNTPSENGQIIQKCCPLCRTPLLRINHSRYSAILRKNLDEIKQVKCKIYGIPNDNAKIQYAALEIISKILSQNSNFQEFRLFIVNSLITNFEKPRRRNFINMSSMKANNYKMLAEIWEKEENRFKFFQNVAHKFSLEVKELFEDLQIRHNWLFGLLMKRTFPLHPNEIIDLKQELTRFEHIGELLKRKHPELEGNNFVLASKPNAQNAFENARKIVVNWTAYTPEDQNNFLTELKKFDKETETTLKISEKERLELLSVFNSKGGVGRWFKCKNGHIYVITECAGPMEIARCSECNETIGGLDHRLLSRSRLANEMDGAQSMLYPDITFRNNQYDNDLDLDFL